MNVNGEKQFSWNILNFSNLDFPLERNVIRNMNNKITMNDNRFIVIIIMIVVYIPFPFTQFNVNTFEKEKSLHFAIVLILINLMKITTKYLLSFFPIFLSHFSTLWTFSLVWVQAFVDLHIINIICAQRIELLNETERT